MQLEAQKKLAADIAAVEKAALAILKRGAKISSIVKRLRAAGEEADARVRFLEKNVAVAVAATPSSQKQPAKQPAKTI